MTATQLNIVSMTRFVWNVLFSPYVSINYFHLYQQPDFRAKKSLHEMEEEIMSIGAEQKSIFNRLRLFIDYYLLRHNTDRQKLTDFVSSQISLYAKVCGPNIRPMVVKRRRTADELKNMYIDNNSTSELKLKLATSESDVNSVLPLDDKGAVCDEPTDETCNMDGEVMEVLVSPEDIPTLTETPEISLPTNHRQQNKSQLKQESLLKPKAERISLPKKERATATSTVTHDSSSKPSSSSTSTQGEALNLGRLKLKQALLQCRANVTQKPVEKIRVKSPSPDTVKYIPTEANQITILSSSSSSSSSEDIFETLGRSDEYTGPTTLSQEPFLRYFGLYTHTYSTYLNQKRSARKRRLCTSTEHRNFHYGRLDLFEKQYANKRNKRQFLYSPPATRAKKQRRAASDAESLSASAAGNFATGHRTKSTASSSSSQSSSNGIAYAAKVCVKCFKRSKFPFVRLPIARLLIVLIFIVRQFTRMRNMLGQIPFRVSCWIGLDVVCFWHLSMLLATTESTTATLSHSTNCLTKEICHVRQTKCY